MLIYASFAMMVWRWLPFLVLAWVWSGLFAVNMIMKEASMSRYAEWQAYRARTGWLLPKLFTGTGGMIGIGYRDRKGATWLEALCFATLRVVLQAARTRSRTAEEGTGGCHGATGAMREA